jgi:hippurate hydrolase
VLVNSEHETALARAVAQELVGSEHVTDIEQVTGSEDFAYMLQERPGCLLRIGNGAGNNVPLRIPRVTISTTRI